MQRIDHVGLVVRDLDQASDFLRQVLGCSIERGQRDQIGQRVELLRSNEIEFELIEHLHPIAVGHFREDGADCQFHHLAVEVADIAITKSELTAKGVKFDPEDAVVSDIPNRGRRSTLFTSPETSGGLIYQFVQYL